MKIARRAPARALVTLGLLFGVVSPASGAIVINEIESQSPAGDFVELMNTGPGEVDISGYVVKDSGNNNAFTVPGGTPAVAANGFYLVSTPTGLGNPDAVRLFAPGIVDPIDHYEWVPHAAVTYGRCPDGTGAMTWSNSATPGTANDCPGPAAAWPGGSAVSVVDAPGSFPSVLATGNLSGLAYQPSGTSARGVLWMVRNNPSTLFRLVYDGTKWTSDTTNGWSLGKRLHYPDGSENPDAEGVSLAGGDPNAVYVSTERNDTLATETISRPAVLRFDVSSPAATLDATRDWNLTADLPLPDANGGLEAITWVPDSVLVSKGFLDESKAALYKPADYPDHGTGLFFVAVEEDGKIIAYALNRTADTFTRVAAFASGFPKLMGLEYEPESTHLWAMCDNGCDGRHAKLDIAQTGLDKGRYILSATFARPAGMENLNNEGFAITPQQECAGGFKPVFWSDDSATPDMNALRAGTLSCTVLPPATVEPTPTPTPTPAPAVAPTPTPTPSPAGPADVTAPSLKVAIKSTKRLRRTGRLGVALTLNERADLTLTATARRNARARARRIVRATRPGVLAGRRTLTLTLSRKVRRALRRGETLTLTVVARDAARNTTTRRAKARVR
jgi:hypothetical protein